METKRRRRKFLIICLFYLIPENQEPASESNRYTETHIRVTSHSNNAISFTMEAATTTPPPTPKPPAQKFLKRNFLFKNKSPNKFCPPDQKKEKRNPRLTHLKAAVALLLSLQRQDLLC